MLHNQADESLDSGDKDVDEGQLVLLMKTQSEPEAKIVKSILEEFGIGCVLVTPVVRSLHPFTVDGLAVILIKVLASQLESAQAVLSECQTGIGPEAMDFPDE